MQRQPKLVYNSLSIHMVDLGCGSNNIVTFRLLESEEKFNERAAHWGVEERNESGVLGRLMAGVKKKLCNLMISGGVSHANPELADSSGALVAYLISVVHGFSQSALHDDIQLWIDKVIFFIFSTC